MSGGAVAVPARRVRSSRRPGTSQVCAVPRHVLAPPSLAMYQPHGDEVVLAADTAALVEHHMRRLDVAFREHVAAVLRRLGDLPRPQVSVGCSGTQVDLRWQNGSMALMARGTVVVSVVGTASFCTERPLYDPALLRYIRKARFSPHPFG